MTGRDGYAAAIALGEIAPVFEGKQVILTNCVDGHATLWTTTATMGGACETSPYRGLQRPLSIRVLAFRRLQTEGVTCK
jgi:hypothetical protein